MITHYNRITSLLMLAAILLILIGALLFERGVL